MSDQACCMDLKNKLKDLVLTKLFFLSVQMRRFMWVVFSSWRILAGIFTSQSIFFFFLSFWFTPFFVSFYSHLLSIIFKIGMIVMTRSVLYSFQILFRNRSKRSTLIQEKFSNLSFRTDCRILMDLHFWVWKGSPTQVLSFHLCSL